MASVHPFGTISVCVHHGTATSIKDGEFYVQIQLPAQCFAGASVLKTPRRTTASLEWNSLQTIPLTAQIPADAKFIVALFQANRVLADDKLAMASIPCEALLRGETIAGDYALVARDGKEVAKVSLRFSWEEVPPTLGGGLSADSDTLALMAGNPALAAATAGASGTGAQFAAAQAAVAAASKQLPPCKGQDFAIRVHFHKAKQLMSTKSDKEFSARASCTVGKHVEVTDVVRETLEPSWDQEVTFTVLSASEEFWNETISLAVVDTKGLLATTIGTFDLDCGNVYRAPQHILRNKWVVLRKSLDEETVMGFLKVTVAVLNLKKDPFPEVDDGDANDEDESDEALISNLIATAGAAFEQVYLHCDVVRAMDLPQMDIGGTADPYVKLIFGSKSVQTANIRNTLAPQWNTQVQLPILLPSLASSLAVQLWDYDTTSADDLIGTERLRWDSLRACGLVHPVARGLPALPATWINIYGHPRGEDADFNAYYKAQARGEKKGLDYRGRVLLRITGSKSRVAPPQLPIEENEVEVHIHTEIMLVSMIPSNGRFKVRVSCGLFSATTQVKEAVRMRGPDTQFCCYFGERIDFTAKFPVIVPTADYDARIEDQIPDVLFQLVDEPLVDLSFATVHGKAKETLAFASTHFSAEKVMKAVATTSGGSAFEPLYICKPMRLSIDPDKTKEGAYPANPLCQLACGMTLIKFAKAPGDSAQLPRADALSPTPRNWAPVMMPPSEPMRRAVLHCFVYQARDVPAGDDNGLSDPFVRISWSNCIAQTTRRDETLNPTFNELVRLEADVRPRYPDVVVELWDFDMIGKNTFLAKGVVPFENCLPAAAGQAVSPVQWITKMTDSLGNRLEGTSVLLAFEVHLDGARAPQPKAAKFARKTGERGVEDGFEIPAASQLRTKQYTLSGSVLGLRNMRKYRLRDLRNPRCEVECAGFRIEIGDNRANGPNPDYKRAFHLNLTLPENPLYLPSLNIRIFDDGVVTGRTYVAAAAIPLCGKGGRGVNERLSAQWHERQRKEVALRIADNAAKIDAKKRGSDGLPDFPAVASARSVAVGGSGGGGPARSVTFRSSAAAVLAVMDPKGGRAAADSGATSVPLLDDGEEGEELSDVHTLHLQQHQRGGGEAVGGVTAVSQRPRTAVGVDDAINSVLGENVRREAEESARRAIQEERRKRGLDVIDTDSDASSFAGDEPLWFDRFEPENAGLEVAPEQRVSRLGKLGVPDPDHRTLEDVFGPFDDDHDTIELMRGWGRDAKKAGVLRAKFVLSDLQPGVKSSLEPQPMGGHEDINFVARVYVIGCSHLAALDSGPLGRASDPYLIFKLHGGGRSRDQVVVSCKEEGKFQTLNPEFYLLRELEGNLARHSTLTVTVMDFDRVGRDEEIGATEISLEDRWHSSRGYGWRDKRGWDVGTGSYTETRPLLNRHGHSTGSIELWVDMFDKRSAPIPRPIDIAPPPPIELELRAVVWNTRDVELTDHSIHGEDMTDIYVRCFLNGMRHDVQNTDVHYRSLDGSGNFNWRMIFTFMFDPRTKTITPVGEHRSKIASLFSVRREQRKLKPILHVQIFDNDLLPGTDDFIGEAALDLLALRPTHSRRRRETLLEIIGSDATACCRCDVWPCSMCCPSDGAAKRLTLTQKQSRARAELRDEIVEQERSWNAVVDEKLATLREIDPHMSRDEERALRRKLKRAVKRSGLINIFDGYLPKRRRSAPATSDLAAAASALLGADANSASGDLGGRVEAPDTIETAKYWFSCRGPCGGGRVGDVQLSFQLVRVDAIAKDDGLSAGKGRSEPHALPEPDRPDSSFFWLSSPFKAAAHILWKNYKWYFCFVVCFVLSAIFAYVFASTGLRVKAENFFK